MCIGPVATQHKCKHWVNYFKTWATNNEISFPCNQKSKEGNHYSNIL